MAGYYQNKKYATAEEWLGDALKYTPPGEVITTHLDIFESFDSHMGKSQLVEYSLNKFNEFIVATAKMNLQEKFIPLLVFPLTDYSERLTIWRASFTSNILKTIRLCEPPSLYLTSRVLTKRKYRLEEYKINVSLNEFQTLDEHFDITYRCYCQLEWNDYGRGIYIEYYWNS